MPYWILVPQGNSRSAIAFGASARLALIVFLAAPDGVEIGTGWTAL